jgi:hypothetical protein
MEMKAAMISGLRPLYEAILAVVQKLGADVEIAPLRQ